MKQIAQRWYHQGEIVQHFLVEVIEPYLTKPTVLDQTIEGLHLRARYWLDSMLRLRSMFDFQAVMAGARAALEAAVDVTLLLHDADGSRLAAVHAWERSARLHAAQKALRHATGAGKSLIGAAELASVVSTTEAEVNADRVARGWTKKTKSGVKPRHPDRWTARDLGSDCDEAERLLDPQLRSSWLQLSLRSSYAEIYSWMCWNTHASGLLPMRGTLPDIMDAYCGLGFLHIQQVALYTGGAVLKHHGKLQAHERDIQAFHRERVGQSAPRVAARR